MISVSREKPVVTVMRREPQPILVERAGVNFYIRGTFVTFYKWAERCGFLEEFMEETKPYWYPDFTRALREKQEAEEAKRSDHEVYMEKRRLWENEKKRIRRMREKENSVLSPENAAVNPLRG